MIFRGNVLTEQYCLFSAFGKNVKNEFLRMQPSVYPSHFCHPVVLALYVFSMMSKMSSILKSY